MMQKYVAAVVALTTVLSLPALAKTPELPAAVITTEGGCVAAWPTQADSNAAGSVHLALLVKEDGRASDVKVLESSKSRELDKAAMYAVAKCRYVPDTFNGAPRMHWFQLKFDWVPGQAATAHD
ncbi:TonB family protein [Duganella sp. FT80W]|uniref:TonB family protein n=1 Tax=Duganella guangzhouensis TaxID=2666084 RepID=A0A6I2KTE6_9BURK|nr:energy transducer TonB [Duganella guangzhouensis]MRW89043.1 TonB family protein [Duganella guangzhouensis]